MNKLRLIKIYELKGRIHPIETTIIELLDGIEKHQKNGYGYINYFKDDILYFAYYPKSNNIYLYLLIYELFKCSYKETKEIIKYLLEKHLKLKINNVE